MSPPLLRHYTGVCAGGGPPQYFHHLREAHLRGGCRACLNSALLPQLAAAATYTGRCRWVHGCSTPRTAADGAAAAAATATAALPCLHVAAPRCSLPATLPTCCPLLSSHQGTTRFEDDTRLPLGLSVNSASYAAKTLSQVGACVLAVPNVRAAERYSRAAQLLLAHNLPPSECWPQCVPGQAHMVEVSHHAPHHAIA